MDCTTSRTGAACRLALAAATLVGWTAATLCLRLTAAQFQAGVSLVQVYATVTDASGMPVAGLGADAFRVFEDDVPQRVSVFAAGEFPLSVAVAVDRSFSMRGSRLAAARAGARAFIGALRPEDQAMLLAVGSTVETVVPLGADRTRLLEGLAGLDAWGTTSLYDAAVAAIDAVRGTGGRRALVLLSDGIDRYSQTSAAALIDHARQGGVLVYPVGVGTRQSGVLAEMAGVSGARAILVRDPRTLTSSLKELASELRTQYLLGYVPARPGGVGEAGRWHTIEVRTTRPGLSVRARAGYAEP